MPFTRTRVTEINNEIAPSTTHPFSVTVRNNTPSEYHLKG